VGAVSCCGLLTRHEVPSPTDRPVPSRPSDLPGPHGAPHPLFDVEQFRSLPHRHAVAHRVEQPTVVLGSTQRPEVVDAARATEKGMAVVRRRGGGGAVLLRPGDHLWVEAWIPRDDPLWEADVAVAAEWVGAWWVDALGTSGGTADLVVHRGPAVPGPHGGLVCFSGRGPGEVFEAERKVMGISQWRSREGSLFHTCAYTHWDPDPLIDLLDVDAPTRTALRRDLPRLAAGILDLGLETGADPTPTPARAPTPPHTPAPPRLPLLEQKLLTTFPSWEKDGSTRPV
jgi:lipoate---protein ligase